VIAVQADATDAHEVDDWCGRRSTHWGHRRRRQQRRHESVTFAGGDDRRCLAASPSSQHHWGTYGPVGTAVRPDTHEGMRRMSRYRVAVDVGGTFTDLIVHDEESGSVAVAKTASIPTDPAAAIMAALEQASIEPRDMAFFAHGSTVKSSLKRR
jgi:hypothetical protein